MRQIYDSLRACDGDRAPEPDCVNLKFLQEYWRVVKQDFLEFFNHIPKNSSFVKSINFTFLVLVPKKKNTKQISDFRPISLIGSAYKILSKVLANRLSKVISSIIGENQQVVVHGKHITDVILMANEIVDEGSRKKKPRYSL